MTHTGARKHKSKGAYSTSVVNQGLQLPHNMVGAIVPSGRAQRLLSQINQHQEETGDGADEKKKDYFLS